jgi:hypothetical protein
MTSALRDRSRATRRPRGGSVVSPTESNGSIVDRHSDGLGRAPAGRERQRPRSTMEAEGRRGAAISVGSSALRLDPVEPYQDGRLAPDRAGSDRSGPGARPARAPLHVAPPLPVAVPRAPFLVLVLTIVIAGVLGVLVINTKINENAFRLDDLRQSQTALDQQEQQLAQQLAEREAPGNLAAAARRLGLVPAQTPAFIRLPDGHVLGVPQPAGGSVSAGAER